MSPASVLLFSQVEERSPWCQGPCVTGTGAGAPSIPPTMSQFLHRCRSARPGGLVRMLWFLPCPEESCYQHCGLFAWESRSAPVFPGWSTGWVVSAVLWLWQVFLVPSAFWLLGGVKRSWSRLVSCNSQPVSLLLSGLPRVWQLWLVSSFSEPVSQAGGCNGFG